MSLRFIPYILSGSYQKQTTEQSWREGGKSALTFYFFRHSFVFLLLYTIWCFSVKFRRHGTKL